MKIQMHLLYVVFLWSVLSLAASFRTWDNFWNEDPYIAKLVSLENNSHYPIIIIGDSVIRTIFPEDKDQRGIDQMLGDALGKEVLDLSRSGTPLETQIHILEILMQKNITTDLFVLEINPLNIIRKENQEKIIAWREHINLMESDIHGFAKLLHHILTLDRKLLQQPKETAIHIVDDVKCLAALHQMIKKAVSISPQFANQVLFFITPINFTALRIKSKCLDTQSKAHIDVITSTCENSSVILINLYDTLADVRYFPDDGGCHLNDKGRQFVVDEIVKKL